MVSMKSSLLLIFGLDPDIIKPQQTSSLVKYLVLQSCKTNLKIRGSEYLFLIMITLNILQSYTNWRELSFFLIKNTGIVIRNLERYILPVWRFSARKLLSSNCSVGNSKYTLDNLGSASDTNSIAQYDLSISMTGTSSIICPIIPYVNYLLKIKILISINK